MKTNFTVEVNLKENKSKSIQKDLKHIFSEIKQKPFVPHPRYKQAHLMILAGHFWPRDKSIPEDIAEERIFHTDVEAKILAHCHWQPNRYKAATLVMAHGLEGSSKTHCMISTAIKAIKAGFNVLRVNQRGGGGTHHLSPSPYHLGLSDDLRAIIKELIEVDKLEELYLRVRVDEEDRYWSENRAIEFLTFLGKSFIIQVQR